MEAVSNTYDAYTDERRVSMAFTFGLIAPEAAELAQPAASGSAPMAQISQTTDEVQELSDDFTTLERNMWRLDGSRELFPPNVSGLQTGWISNVLSGADRTFATAPWLEFTFSEPQTSFAFTMYFDSWQPDNFPAEIVTTAFDENGNSLGSNTTQPTGPAAIISFSVQRYARLRFTFTKTSLPFRRVRVAEVVFGVIYDYTGSMLKSMTYRNSNSPTANTLPFAEIDAVVNNQNQAYNMIAPDGFYAYLQNGQTAAFSATVNGEKVNLGTYYYATAESEDGGLTASITFADWISLLDSFKYESGATGTWTLSQAVAAFLAVGEISLPVVYDDNLGSVVIRKAVPQNTTLREAVRLAAQAAMCTCYVDRLNRLHFTKPQTSAPVDELKLRYQIKPAQVKVGEYFNQLQLTVPNEYTDGEEEVYTSGTVPTGEMLRLHEVVNPLVNSGQAVADWLFSWVQRRVTYDVDYRGNPALDLLDTITINDVYKVNGDALITELRFSFDGGLSGSIKAVR